MPDVTKNPLQRLELRAMNSDIELISCAPDAERRLRRAAQWLQAYENCYSRFQPLSELSRLNAAAGKPRRVSRGLFELVWRALAFAAATDGLFDPTILRQLEAAGYDRSFEQLAPRRPPSSHPPKVSWRNVVLDAAQQTICLPDGSGIDLGGIGKGWATDRLAELLGTPSLVNGGGDVRVRGKPPGDDAWRVGVADPFAPQNDLMVLSFAEDAGVATSSSLKRTWRIGDAYFHHLIDPRTGRPSASDLVQVTVVAPTTVEADVYAKVALLLGSEAALPFLDSRGLRGVCVTSKREVLETKL
jgi:thiamine biosynthesis lipoprotein